MSSSPVVDPGLAPLAARAEVDARLDRMMVEKANADLLRWRRDGRQGCDFVQDYPASLPLPAGYSRGSVVIDCTNASDAAASVRPGPS